MRVLKNITYSRESNDIKKANATADFDDEVGRLVGRIPNAGKTKSDRLARFRFPAVAPGVQYLIVTQFSGESGDFFGARSTPALKPGQNLSLDVTIFTMPWLMEEGDCSEAR